MPQGIVYPQGCRPVQEELGPDELIRRLKVSYLNTELHLELLISSNEILKMQTLAHTLQAMGQDNGIYQQYIPLALHLADDFFLQHQSKDVQLLIACCIADVLRVYAPEAPYKDPEQIKVRYCSFINFHCWKMCIFIALILFLDYIYIHHKAVIRFKRSERSSFQKIFLFTGKLSICQVV